MTKHTIWKPTKEEKDLIKFCAVAESGVPVSRLVLEPGIRCNTDTPERTYPYRGEYNIAFITDCEHWEDTDLEDYGSWAEFCRGVALTEDGRAIVDFYLAPKDGYLEGNLTIEYSDGTLMRVYGYPREYLNVKEGNTAVWYRIKKA